MVKLRDVVLLLLICLVDARTKTKKYTEPESTLELLHIVFRHGDRTQDGTYPTDPYQNEMSYPIGVGQLTNAGKRRAYKIGTYLRETYERFLGEEYSPGILEAFTSPYPRCKNTIQLVLAGLYPPSESLQWSDFLNWQPIPYDYLPISENHLLWAFAICPGYSSAQAKYMLSDMYNDVYAPYQDVIRYLQEKSGIVPNSMGMGIALTLYSTLRSQQDLNLELPEWTESVWPEPIGAITQLDWQQMFGSEEARALGAGFLMSKIVNDTQLTITKDKSVENMKIHLYSGHDANIAAVLSWLGTPDLHIPEYGSFVIFEIHNISGVRHIKVINQNYEDSTPQLVKIPNCGFICPFSQFVELYSRYLNPAQLCN